MITEEEIEALLDGGHRKEAIVLLEKQLEEQGQQETVLLRLGELIYAEGRMSDALNKFNGVLRLNPGNQKARNYAAMINGILGYYCKDLLNP